MRPTRPIASPARGSTTTDRTRASTTSARATAVRRSRRPSGSTHRSSTAPAARSPRAASMSTRPGSPPPAGSRIGRRRLVSSTCAAIRTTGRRRPGIRSKRLTSLSGRVDFPTVAAAGANVYVVYTDSATGSVKVKISRDRAATWKTVTLGSTAWSTPSGRYGIPRIAASGNTVVVAWLSTAAARSRRACRRMPAGPGAPTGGLTGSSTDIPAVAALGTRAAVAWTDGSSAVVRTWSAGPGRRRGPPGQPPAAYTHSYGPAIALSGSAGIGVAWTRLRHDLRNVELRHARQPRLERVTGRWSVLVRGPGHRIVVGVIGSPVQRLSLDPVAIRHGPPCALECRDGRDELLPHRPADRDRLRSPRRPQARSPRCPRDPAKTEPASRPKRLAISRSALTDRPGNRKSACRLAGALPSGLGIVTRRP